MAFQVKGAHQRFEINDTGVVHTFKIRVVDLMATPGVTISHVKTLSPNSNNPKHVSWGPTTVTPWQQGDRFVTFTAMVTSLPGHALDIEGKKDTGDGDLTITITDSTTQTPYAGPPIDAGYYATITEL